MASPLSTSKIISQLKKFGVTYREYPGWKTRGRPGTFAPNGFVVHHTGGGSGSDSYLKFLFETGRPAEGIPGPLCQFAVDANGIVHVGAAGRANHAGKGSSATLDKVVNESYSGYTSEINPGPDNIDGNARYYGVEVIYTGLSEMTTKQYWSTVKLAAAIVDAYGWSALSVIAHREHSSRKWDPGKTSLARFRRDVRDVLRGISQPLPEPKEWWEMAIPDSDLARIAAAVWNRPLSNALSTSTYTAEDRLIDAEVRIGRAQGALDAMKPLLEAAAAGKALTATEVQEIAEACKAAVTAAMPADIANQFVAALKEAL